MRGKYAALIATAVLFFVPTLASEAEAQVGTSTLDGMVCAEEPVYYIMAPEDGAYPCGRGLPGATVHIVGAGPLGSSVGGADKTDTTDENGMFHFEMLSDGEYSVEVARTGFDTLTATATVAGNSKQDFAVVPQKVEQAGKVMDEDGKAVADASVFAYSNEGQGHAVTGADGTFRLATLAGWRYFEVQASGFQPASQEALADGTGSVEINLLRQPPQDAKLVGRVTDQDGKAISGIAVHVSGGGGGCCYDYACAPPPPGAEHDYACARPYYGMDNKTTTGGDGRYSINVYSGYLSVYVSQEGYASHSAGIEVAPGATVTHDVKLLKFPEKTARIEGRITDAGTGDGLRLVSLTVRSPEYGIHECSDNGVHSPYESYPEPAKPMPADSTAIYPAPEQPDCAIEIDADGNFAGQVTPGYAIVNAYFEHYKTCTTTMDADGASTTDCAPDYFYWSRTLVLPKDATTRIDVKMVMRPQPDAVASGYVVDGSTGKAVPQAWVYFSNQENHAGGQAQTDGDGSYKIRLRHGYHTVSVWAEGYLPWEGVLEVPVGEAPFDITLTPGQEAGYGCWDCRMYAADAGHASPSYAGAEPKGMPGAPEKIGTTSTGGEGASAEVGATAYEDLKGGLGPYDAEARKKVLEDAAVERASPALPLLVGILVLAFLASRRR